MSEKSGDYSLQPVGWNALSELVSANPTDRIWVGGHDTELRAVIDRELAANPRPPTGQIDAGYVTAKTMGEAVYFAGKLRSRVSLQGTIWVFVRASSSPSQVERDAFENELITQLEQMGLGRNSANPPLMFGDYHIFQFTVDGANPANPR